jgi:hypothetical protein
MGYNLSSCTKRLKAARKVGLNQPFTCKARSASDELKTSYNNKWDKIYNDTDTAVQSRIAKEHGLSDPKQVDVIGPTNPSAKIKVRNDRDVTYRIPAKEGQIIPDPDNPNAFIRAKGGEPIDVDARKIYNEEFYKTARGKDYYPDLTPDQFAEKMDQLATTRLHPEAYGRGPKDLRIATEEGLKGEAFSDPTQVGLAARYKAEHWYNNAEKAREIGDLGTAETHMAEGMRQTTKQFNNQVVERVKAIKKGVSPEVAEKMKIDPKLTKAVEIMRGPERGISPTLTEKFLKDMGLTPREVSAQVGQYIEMLQKLGPR